MNLKGMSGKSLANPGMIAHQAPGQGKILAVDIILGLTYSVVLISLCLLPIQWLYEIFPLIGSAMILFVPGYAVISLLYPAIKPGSLTETVALSAGLSAALAFLVGISLSIAVTGIRLSDILLCLSVLSVPCFIILYLRRRRLGHLFSGRAYNDESYPQYVRTIIDLADSRRERYATAALTACLIILIIATAYIAIMPHQGEKFTEFYLLGPEGKAMDYPRYFNIGDQKPLIVGVANHEYRTADYDLLVVLNDSNRITKMYTDSFTLAHNQTLEKTVLLEPDHTGKNMKIEFSLYIDGNLSSTYRNLDLSVSVY